VSSQPDANETPIMLQWIISKFHVEQGLE